ncbi:hypothetical protein ACMD2_22842 [Ananas comosus]|uniref:Uncharacterized protein n=1 Tax=Ananas comosus TaxID=4615 RepID=A0A199V0Q7_ANACO|nr:hypothetical protein ACMD2_22842 [Ananas comosus]
MSSSHIGAKDRADHGNEPPSEKRGSTAKSRTKIPTSTLIIATRWNAIRQPAIPMIVVDASIRAKKPPMMEPILPVS